MINVMLFKGKVKFLNGVPVCTEFMIKTLTPNEIVEYQAKLDDCEIYKELQKDYKTVVVKEDEEYHKFTYEYDLEALFNPEIINDVCRIIIEEIEKMK